MSEFSDTQIEDDEGFQDVEGLELSDDVDLLAEEAAIEETLAEVENEQSSSLQEELLEQDEAYESPESVLDVDLSAEQVAIEEALAKAEGEPEARGMPSHFTDEEGAVIGPEQTELYHSPETSVEKEAGHGPKPSWDAPPSGAAPIDTLPAAADESKVESEWTSEDDDLLDEMSELREQIEEEAKEDAEELDEKI